jgi:uncharacterized protein YutE (UPF0331/DUF86 family)
VTFLVERLAELRRYLEHLRRLRPRVRTAADLERDLSLHNDVLFSLLQVCQLVIDVAGELSTRRGRAFEDYTGAVRNLGEILDLTSTDLDALAQLPGFRNVVIHEYLRVDLERAVRALDELAPVDRLIQAVARIEEAE